MLILESGTKVLVAHRRLFPGDHGRYFVGIVEAYDSGVARIDGHTWRDAYDGEFHRKDDVRTKIVSIASGTVIVYQLPSSVDLDSFRFHNEDNRIVARDQFGFEMDLSEGVLPGGSEARPGRERVA